MRLAQSLRKTERRWGGHEVVKEILFAAAVQAPGLPGSASRRAWESLMTTPAYATLALLGVGQTLDARLPCLKTWWESCPTDERTAELNQMVFAGVKAESGNRSDFLDLLRSRGRAFPKDLRTAIDDALEANGASRVFPDSSEEPRGRLSVRNATLGAGLRREYLLVPVAA